MARRLSASQPLALTQVRVYRSSLEDRQRERAWSQEIVFLPPAVAKREEMLVRERQAEDYLDGVAQVHSLQHDLR